MEESFEIFANEVSLKSLSKKEMWDLLTIEENIYFPSPWDAHHKFISQIILKEDYTWNDQK